MSGSSDRKWDTETPAPWRLARIALIVLSVPGVFIGALVGFSDSSWEAFVFAAFWLVMFLIGLAGWPRILFQAGLPGVDFEADGFQRYTPVDYGLLVAMALLGLAYIPLARVWPALPQIGTGDVVLYAFVATAADAYIWQRKITGSLRAVIGYLCSLAAAIFLIKETPPSGPERVRTLICQYLGSIAQRALAGVPSQAAASLTIFVSCLPASCRHSPG